MKGESNRIVLLSVVSIMTGYMNSIVKISKENIEHILENVCRQYLVGDLKRPQELEHIQDSNLEIGITDYSEYTTEPVHFHTTATEYQYMLSGWTQYMDVNSGKVYEFKRGDFFGIKSNTTYAQKSKKGTRILFIKVPSINDKKIIESDERVEKWYADGLKTIRKDYSHEINMPVANSMRPAAAVAIINNENILMLKRVDNKKWTLPGGTMELDESLIDCAVREVKEETNLDVKIEEVIGTYTDPDIRIEYSDGEVRREFTIVYYGTVSDCDVTIDHESSSYLWIPINEVQTYPMADSQKKRITDVISFVKTGKKRMG